MAPAAELSGEARPGNRAPLPGDSVYKKPRFNFNPPRNTIGWILIGLDDTRVSIFSPRSHTWLTGGYLSLKPGITFSDKETFLKKFKEGEIAYLTGNKTLLVTKQALNEGFINIYGDMDFGFTKEGETVFYTTEYFSDVPEGELSRRLKVFLYLLPDKNLRGMYAIAMVVPAPIDNKVIYPTNLLREVVSKFIIKE